MSEMQEFSPVNNNMDARTAAAKTNALIAYGLMCVGLFTGIFWIAGAIWAMVKASDAAGTPFADHYTNIIKIFWIGLGVAIIGFFLAFIFIGYFILIGVWIWSVFKLVKGLARITSNQSYNS